MAALKKRQPRPGTKVTLLDAAAALLTQVLRSLITNAMEAMDVKSRGGAGGKLRISVARGQGAGVTLEVRDSGPGLTPEQLARVGRPFYTTKPRGLGVGLALARRVADSVRERFDVALEPEPRIVGASFEGS